MWGYNSSGSLRESVRLYSVSSVQNSPDIKEWYITLEDVSGTIGRIYQEAIATSQQIGEGDNGSEEKKTENET
jgi:hypothetical protein